MSYYNFKITNGEEKILNLTAHDPFYDNVIFWQLAKLVNVIKNGVDDERLFISRVYSNTECFEVFSTDEEPDTVIDIKTKTVTNPKIYCYKSVEELQKDYPGNVKYRERDGKFFAKWDDEDEYEIKKILISDESILDKDTLTFDEVIQLDTFVGYLLDIGDLEYVLPSGRLIRLNLA